MELQVLVSKKGTKVVTATNLYYVLELSKPHFAVNVKKWLNDIYEFKDGIRRPERMRDFARRKIQDNPIVEDYYLSIELAKLITLNSKSRVKKKYAKYLYSMEDQVEDASLMSMEQVLAVLELTKAMGFVSCQESSERKHMKIYENRNGGSASNWWKYRAQILGYSAEKLRKKMQKMGQDPKGKSQRKMLMQMDKSEMIRTGIIDLFMGMGKSERYARQLGDLAKGFAREFGIEIVDDRKNGSSPLPSVNPELMDEVKDMRKGAVLSLW